MTQHLSNFNVTESSPTIGIYIHIPFCVRKCDYCDFVSIGIGTTPSTSTLTIVDQYFNALQEEIKLYDRVLKDKCIKTIYFGGGTPSAIDSHYIVELIDLFKKTYFVDEQVEITLEVNPGTLTEPKIKDYIQSGINRISMGLQTANDTLLASIGRIHTRDEFIHTYNWLRTEGFENISLDLMIGLPGQTMRDIEDALQLVTLLDPPHVSAYSLKVEPGTLLNRKLENHEVELIDEAIEREMYHYLVDSLKSIHIEQYELSNFAKKGFESQHNLIYWENKPYLGLGVSAHSKVDSERFGNTRSMADYINCFQHTGQAIDRPIIESEKIDLNEDLFETIMLGLRLNKGISISEIESMYKISFKDKYETQLNKLISNALIVLKEDCIYLTELGRDLANQVFVEFMD